MKRTDHLWNAGRPLLAPSLLGADFTCLDEALRQVATADALHLDIMDGHFVPNISYGPGLVKQLRPLWDKVFDVHLMVTDPDRWIAPFVDAGADIIVFHAEATPHAHRVIQKIKKAGCLAGIALNPGSPLALVEPLLPFLDQVLLMTVNPGFGGQSYIPEVEAKMRALTALARQLDHPLLLQIDGGVNVENIGQAARAGANFFVAGTSIFKADDPRLALEHMRLAVEQALLCGKV